MKENNIIKDKSYQFSLKIVRVYRYLTEQKKEYVLSRQMLRSGTSIGANVEEAIGGQTSKDFLTKLSIAYKESRETCYWLRLLKDSGYLDVDADVLLSDCNELQRILCAILKTLKSNMQYKNR
ncbi:MAG: four helix bundle protein [Planctomycetes bacterium]|nr:four helix bundle protein [Planctomycetota bacterium]